MILENVNILRGYVEWLFEVKNKYLFVFNIYMMEIEVNIFVIIINVFL